MLRIIPVILLALILVGVIIATILGRGMFGAYTDPITTDDGTEIEGSIAELKKIELGGMDQYILMRGVNKSNPVLLWLHGGPGAAEVALAHHFNKGLEKEFVVVHWDQRGAGKSNHRGFDAQSMSLEQYLNDARELITYLKQRFGQDRIFLLGHSWGSHLGIELAARYPDDLHAYIGVSQVVDNHRTYKIGYEWVREQIGKQQSGNRLNQIEMLGEPPYTRQSDHKEYTDLINEYGGNFDLPRHRLAWIAIRAPEYNLLDYFRWMLGARRGSGPMWDNRYTNHINMISRVHSLDVPVFFMSGRKDYTTPCKLVKQYYDVLEAPHKELIIFEDSAHTPFLGEVEKFTREVIQVKGK